MTDHLLNIMIWGIQIFQVIALVVIQRHSGRIEKKQQSQTQALVKMLAHIERQEDQLLRGVTPKG